MTGSHSVRGVTVYSDTGPPHAPSPAPCTASDKEVGGAWVHPCASVVARCGAPPGYGDSGLMPTEGGMLSTRSNGRAGGCPTASRRQYADAVELSFAWATCS